WRSTPSPRSACGCCGAPAAASPRRTGGGCSAPRCSASGRGRRWTSPGSTGWPASTASGWTCPTRCSGTWAGWPPSGCRR
ncbi:MAG: hypothetical protein AVDCRST_MAG04-3932, partial [uncultured Acetobacteraceae bacterium]